jgi:hypothetical protein
VILFFEGHVFKALGNSFVPSGIQHKFVLSRVRVSAALKKNLLAASSWARHGLGLRHCGPYRLIYDYTVLHPRRAGVEPLLFASQRVVHRPGECGSIGTMGSRNDGS